MAAWFDKNKHKYPPNWKEIAFKVKERAGFKCEACLNPHGKSPYVLTVDHVIDHDPANVEDWNLVALCQRCHLRRQGMRPLPKTKEEAIRRLRQRYEAEQAQLRLEGLTS
jgi:5-methylcytosine-specific restriction endonuclease McrA